MAGRLWRYSSVTHWRPLPGMGSEIGNPFFWSSYRPHWRDRVSSQKSCTILVANDRLPGAESCGFEISLRPWWSGQSAPWKQGNPIGECSKPMLVDEHMGLYYPIDWYACIYTYISLCTFPLWHGFTHVPFRGHFSNKQRHFVRTFFWSTMPLCKKRVYCWANHFVRANILYKMASGPIIS